MPRTRASRGRRGKRRRHNYDWIVTPEGWAGPGEADILVDGVTYASPLVYPGNARIDQWGDIDVPANQFQSRGAAEPELNYTVKRVVGDIVIIPDPSWWVAQAYWQLTLRFIVCRFDVDTLQATLPVNYDPLTRGYACEPFLHQVRTVEEFNAEKTFGITKLDIDFRVQRRVNPEETLFMVMQLNTSGSATPLLSSPRLRTLVEWHGQSL